MPAKSWVWGISCSEPRPWLKVGGGLLVAGVDEPDPLVHAPHVDGRDVQAGEGEGGGHAFLPEHAGDELTAGERPHPVLLE
jgi:hypothetical protein